MKILILTTRGDSIGGAQIHIKDLAVRLQKEGHKVLVGLGGTGSFCNLLDRNNITYKQVESLVRPVSLIKDIKAIRQIISLLKEMQPDLVTVHSSKAGLLGRIASKMIGVPVIFTAHGWAFTEGVSSKKRLLYKWIEKFAFYLSDKVITVSNYDRKLALAEHVGNEKKLIAIHNGIEDIDTGLLATHTSSIPKIVMVARFQEPKNHLILIQALANLNTLAWSLELVGEDGGLLEKVKNEVHRYGIEERVSFLGHRDDIESLLAKADIFVLTSHWEGFPLTILEAMRAGLPVIASDVGGVAEAVEDKKTGFLLENKQSLISSLETLVSSANLRNAMGKEGRKRYEELFTFDRMYYKTLKVYESLMIKNR